MVGAMTIAAHSFIVWLIIGLIAGALAGRVVEGGGFGCLADTVIGLAGALIGGALFNQFAPSGWGPGGFVQDVVVAFIGAVLLLAILRLLTPRRNRGGSWRDYWRL